MPEKNKKPDTELTTDEAIHKLFPDEVIEYAEKVAHEHDSPEETNSESSQE